MTKKSYGFKKLVLAAGFLALGLGSASAATLCSTFVGTSIASIGTCDIDLTFGGQSYVVNFSSFSNGGASNAVLGAVDASNLTGQAGLQIVGSPAGTPLATFTGLSYTAQITPGACNIGFTCYIIGQYQQAAFGALGDPTGTVAFTTDTCFVPPTLTPAASTYGPALCSSRVSGTDTVTATYSTVTNTLNNFESDVYVGNVANSGVPEPTTFVLMGAGLGLLGMLRRKTARR